MTSLEQFTYGAHAYSSKKKRAYQSCYTFYLDDIFPFSFIIYMIGRIEKSTDKLKRISIASSSRTSNETNWMKLYCIETGMRHANDLVLK